MFTAQEVFAELSPIRLVSLVEEPVHLGRKRATGNVEQLLLRGHPRGL
jgi:hypothetical protein